MIVVFGAPGSGKTTQIKKLQQSLAGFDVAYQLEPTVGVSELVHAVYDKKPGAVFNLQTHVLTQRCIDYTQVGEKKLIADGHFTTDYRMFVVPHIESGALAGDELARYSTHFKQVLAAFSNTFSRITTLIFIKVNGPVAAKRVAERNSMAESGVDTAVFEKMAERAIAVVRSLNDVPVVEIDGDQPIDVVHAEIVKIVRESLAK
jgi:deoxyadenosine/deoxycytidine kinase